MNLRPTIPFAKLSDVNSDAFYNDQAEALLRGAIFNYATACAAGTPEDMITTRELCKEAIVKAIKDSNTPILKLDNDTCGNG